MDSYKSFIQAGAHMPEQVFRNTSDMFEYRDNVKVFVDKYLKGNMICAGGHLSGVKIHPRVLDSVIPNLTRLKSNYIYKDIPLYLDSGGYQISRGYYTKEQIASYIEVYYRFLVDNSSKFDHAFMLDIPYSEVFKNDVKSFRELNIRSYRYFYQLPRKVKKKMIFISHYGKIEVYKLFDQLMEEMNYLENFKTISIGSISSVSYSSLDHKILGYLRPVLSFLKYYKHNQNNATHLHFLGIGLGSPVTRLVYRLITTILKEVYDIDMLVTHDSTPAKSFTYRLTYLLDKNKFETVQWGTKTLNHAFRNGKTTMEYILDNVNGFLKEDDIGRVDEIPVSGSYKKWFFLYLCYLFKMDYKMNVIYQKWADDLYELFKLKEYSEFSNYFCSNLVQDGNLTKKRGLNATIHTFIKFIELLVNQRYDYAFDHLLNKESMVEHELLQI